MINNLNVYERMKRKETKKKKRKKFKLLIITGILTITTLTSCVINHNNYENKYSGGGNSNVQEVIVVKSESEIAVENLLKSYENKEIDEYSQKIIDSYFTISSADAQYITSQIQSMPTNYAYSELYDVNTAYKTYMNMSEFSGVVYPILESGRVDADELYQLVVKNNITYKENNPYSIYTKLDDKYIREYCDIVADSVNALLDKGWEHNLEDLSYNLQHLCMFKSATGSNAFISNDGCLVVQPSNLDMMKAISNNENADKIAIAHETVHLFQRISTDHKEALGIGMGYGFSYSFDNVKVNSLFNKWYEEATAETIASSLYNSHPTTYSTMISYLNSIRYVHGMKADFDIESLEKLSIQNDIDAVFDAFGCKTEEEKMELLKVFFSINIIQQQPEDFMTLYEEQVLGHEMTEEELIQLQIELKTGICQYLTKQFYANLSTRIAGERIELEDIFKLVSTLESTLNTHLKYTMDERYGTYEIFFDEYITIQNLLFQKIADNLNLSIDDIIVAYNEYNGQMEILNDNMLRETVYEQIEVPWLSSAAQDVVQDKHEETSGKKTIAINEYLNIAQNVKKY